MSTLKLVCTVVIQTLEVFLDYEFTFYNLLGKIPTL